MNENEVMNNEVVENNVNTEVNEQNNAGLTTGEKVAVAGVGAAAIVGIYTVGKATVKYGKKGFAWIKGKFKKKEAEVPVEEPEQVTEQ